MRVTPVTFDPGTVIIREGDEPRGIFIIEAGDVQVYSDKDGTKTHIAKLVRGQILASLRSLRISPTNALCAR